MLAINYNGDVADFSKIPILACSVSGFVRFPGESE